MTVQYTTDVLPKSIESQLQHWDVKEQERVQLEDVRFTNEFLVYSTDQVEARYAISTAMMEKILAFKEYSIEPSEMLTPPAMVLSKVDLPEPLPPKMT